MTTAKKFPRAKPYRLKATEVKALVRYRDGYRCTDCGLTSREHYRRHKKALDVHRLVPGSKYTVKGCVTLCKDCHHKKPKSLRGTGTCPRGFHTISFSAKVIRALARRAEREGRPISWEAERIVIAALRESGDWDDED